MLNRSRIVAASGRRLVTVVESTALAQNMTVHVVKVAVGPLTEEEATGIAEHGDFRPYAGAIEKLANR